MDVIVETNFILAIALRQDGFESAERLLELAESGAIDLKVPSFSLCEPFSTLNRYANARNSLIQTLNSELNQLERTTKYQPLAQLLKTEALKISAISNAQMDDLIETVLRVSGCAILTPLSKDLLEDAKNFITQHALTSQDAIVYASVISELRTTDSTEQRIFVTVNTKDFNLPAIQRELTALNCKYFGDFQNAVNYIERPADGNARNS